MLTDFLVIRLQGTFLALDHEHEIHEFQKMNNGNEEPYRGFGHIGTLKTWKKKITCQNALSSSIQLQRCL